MKHVLFVCTGNTCRSPMAEALLTHKLGNQLQVKSAGVFASEGMPASPNAQAALQEKGIAFDHKSSLLNEDLSNWADIILTMTENHKGVICEKYPHVVNKVYTLKEYVDDDPTAKENWDKLKAAYARLEVKRAEVLRTWQNKQQEKDGQSLDTVLYKAIENELNEIAALESSLPSYDISDPYGGSLAIYKATLAELDEALNKLTKKLGG